MPERIAPASSRCRARHGLTSALLLLIAWAGCTPISPVPDRGDAGPGESSTRLAADGGPGCKRDADCRRSSVCTRAQCSAGRCSEQPEEDGTRLPTDEQIPGDCSTLLCDGAGQTRKAPDDSDTQQGGSDPCRIVECHDGNANVRDAPESTPCNGNGSCTGGRCSVCRAGQDCSRPGDCTVRRWTCEQGMELCSLTEEPREAGACEAGKVCQNGSCVPCTVGAECEVDQECFIGIITSCDGGRKCEPRAVSGPACRANSAGQRRYCVRGACTLPCREGQCMAASDACHTSRWDCSNGDAAPSCVDLASPDGTACGDAASCHAGKCEPNALNNGSFARGLDGWSASGDAASFQLAARAGRVEHAVLSTSADGKSSGGGLRGSLSQVFTVPANAAALRFAVWGGHAHVRLKDSTGNVLEDCTGVDSDLQVPVSWELGARRGQQLTLAIEDDLTSGDWAYVSVSGFDVVRDLDAPLRNAQFAQDWTGWETSGDAVRFNIFADYNYWELPNGVPAYGQRRSVSTYSRDSNGPYGAPAVGSVSQQFIVPADAVALRFQVHGGRAGRVYLAAGAELLHSVSAADADQPKLIVDWPLAADRGKTVRLVIEDTSTGTPLGYIGSSGFDLITSYNGP